jgi:hypothetical protein
VKRSLPPEILEAGGRQLGIPHGVLDILVPEPRLLTVTLIEVRRTVEQLAAGQERMASDIIKLQAVDADIRDKISSAPLRPAAAPASKPTPTSRAPTPLR